MKISDAEWQWDRRKLTLYFTAEKRVDFRNLVRELAGVFRTRIELKQIGVRDEAKRLSGVGRCGREYCSSSWLPDLRPVNLGVAKDQRLSLNPTQISGACGRLMCCLRYEHEFYVQSRRRFPKEGKILRTSLGEEKVMASDIFRDTVTLRTVEGETRVVALAALREEMSKVDPTAAAAAPEHADGESGVETERAVLVATAQHEDDADDRADAVLDADAAHATDAPMRHAPPAAADVDAEDDDASDGDAGTDQDSASDGTDAPRRKRRRGRRGGRRVRGERGDPNTPQASDS
jgi:hypothetical protein